MSYEEVSTYNINFLEGEVEDVLILITNNGGTSLCYYTTDLNNMHSAGGGIDVGVRPAVTLNTGLYVVSGSGAKNDPYVLSTTDPNLQGGLSGGAIEEPIVGGDNTVPQF